MLPACHLWCCCAPASRAQQPLLVCVQMGCTHPDVFVDRYSGPLCVPSSVGVYGCLWMCSRIRGVRKRQRWVTARVFRHQQCHLQSCKGVQHAAHGHIWVRLPLQASEASRSVLSRCETSPPRLCPGTVCCIAPSVAVACLAAKCLLRLSLGCAVCSEGVSESWHRSGGTCHCRCCRELQLLLDASSHSTAVCLSGSHASLTNCVRTLCSLPLSV
jgi:hypothetical protein